MKFHREPISFVSHVNLKVQNLERSIKFYKEIIGLKVLEQTDQVAKLTADGKNVLVSIEQPDNVIPKQPRTTGLYHFALLLPNRSDLGKILTHFLQVGYPLQGASDHAVSEALYLADPDGNGIEIYTDRNPSGWAWNNNEVVMVSEPLDVENLIAEAQGDTWNALPADTLMGHIHLHVSDLKESLDYYINGLGFEVVCRYGSQAIFISDGKYHHHIALNVWNGVGAPQPPTNAVGLESFTINLANEEKRDRIVAHLRNIGASVTEEGGSIFTADPSGNRIHLII